MTKHHDDATGSQCKASIERKVLEDTLGDPSFLGPYNFRHTAFHTMSHVDKTRSVQMSYAEIRVWPMRFLESCNQH